MCLCSSSLLIWINIDQFKMVMRHWHSPICGPSKFPWFNGRMCHSMDRGSNHSKQRGHTNTSTPTVVHHCLETDLVLRLQSPNSAVAFKDRHQHQFQLLLSTRIQNIPSVNQLWWNMIRDVSTEATCACRGWGGTCYVDSGVSKWQQIFEEEQYCRFEKLKNSYYFKTPMIVYSYSIWCIQHIEHHAY